MRVAGCGLRGTGCGLRVAGYALRVAGCELRVAGYELRGTGCGILVAGCWSLVAGLWYLDNCADYQPETSNQVPVTRDNNAQFWNKKLYLIYKIQNGNRDNESTLDFD